MPEKNRTSRRGFLVGGAASIAAAASGVVIGGRVLTELEDTPAPAATIPASLVPFHGAHQAGIAEPGPTHATFVSFTLPDPANRSALAEVLQEWTRIGRAMSEGDTDADPSVISRGSEPGSFTLTVGIGGSGLDKLDISRPAPLVDLPVFVGDQIDEASSRGDVFVQLCSNDAIYLSGAVRAVRRAASGVLAPKWQFNGFRGVGASTSSSNGRNLMGQIDGTNNTVTSRAASGGPVWISDTATPTWMAGGSYIAVRRFRMLLNTWEQLDTDTRGRTLGRHASTGAPLGGENEFDPVDLEGIDDQGRPTIPTDAHIRLAAPARGAGEEMLRRSYSYSNGQNPDTGEEEAGLIFVSYQADPRTSFIPIQQRLAESDALSQYIVATSSALFAILPGVSDAQDWLGRALLST